MTTTGAADSAGSAIGNAWDDGEAVSAERQSLEADDAPFTVALDGYDGPLDLLLDQARAQRVDLSQLSILQLADQYLAFIATARRQRLELAAEYLVMASWLAYLKSRLLLPTPPSDDDPSGEALADALALQLRRLEAMRTAARQLMARPRLGVTVFARGPDAAADAPPADAPPAPLAASLYDLLAAYGAQQQRMVARQGTLTIESVRLYSVEVALRRLATALRSGTVWTALPALLPEPAEPLVDRSALAAHFTAALEMTRDGKAELRQDAPFGTLYLRRATRTEIAPGAEADPA